MAAAAAAVIAVIAVIAVVAAVLIVVDVAIAAAVAVVAAEDKMRVGGTLQPGIGAVASSGTMRLTHGGWASVSCTESGWVGSMN